MREKTGHILGITAEYDPFHRGHAWHLARAREETDPDAVVCVMSGDFTQRGEPAALDKWIRARIAVRQGVDLVLELPFMYACNRAEIFASGAVDLLVKAGVSHISFGCESEEPEKLIRLADRYLTDADRVKEMTRDAMKGGCSRAKAAEMVSRRLFGDELTDLTLSPNNILALEYLKRIRWWEQQEGRRIQSVPIRRRGSGYHGTDPEQGFAGGSALRKMLAAGEDIRIYLPYDPDQLQWTNLPEARQRLYQLLRGILLREDPQRLAGLYCVGEGLENRLGREARRWDLAEDFLTAMVSRRYTAAAIRRVMIYILMNIGEMPVCPPYGRVLAASEAGRTLLRRITDRQKEGDEGLAPGREGQGAGRIPGLTVIAGRTGRQNLPEEMRAALDLDLRAADLYNLICGRDLWEDSDLRQHPRML